MSVMPMGSVDIHSEESGVRAVLTADTIAALEQSLHDAFTRGQVVLLRLVYEGSTQVVSTVVSASTTLKFGYRQDSLESGQVQKMAHSMMQSIKQSSELSIGVPAD